MEDRTIMVRKRTNILHAMSETVPAWTTLDSVRIVDLTMRVPCVSAFRIDPICQEQGARVTPKILGDKLRELLNIPGCLPPDLARLVELLGKKKRTNNVRGPNPAAVKTVPEG